MYARLNCIICHSPISNDRILDNKAYCSCGYVLNLSGKDNDDSSMGTAVRIVFIAFLLLGAFLHAVNWDQYFFTVIPLKVKELSGIATPRELQQLASICEARQKAHCQIRALEAAYRADGSLIEVIPQIATLYAKNKQTKEAVSWLRAYRKAGGKDPSARFEYAKLLAQNGDYRDARREFGTLLNHRGHRLHVPVARAYVGFLIEQNDYVTAKKIIHAYRQTGREMSYFLDKELKYIDHHLNRKTAAHN